MTEDMTTELAYHGQSRTTSLSVFIYMVTVICCVDLQPAYAQRDCKDPFLEAEKLTRYYTITEGNTTGLLVFNFTVLPSTRAGLFSVEQADPVINFTRQADTFRAIINEDIDAESLKDLSLTFNLTCKDDRPTPLEIQFRLLIKDVNEHAPSFVNTTGLTLDLPESIPIQSVVFRLKDSATDEDVTRNALIYSIRNPTSSLPFAISGNSAEGDIILTRRLDYDSGPREYHLPVFVTDSLYTTTSTLTVNVQDVDDQSPMFNHTGAYHWHVEENSTSRQNFSISAYDPDTGVKPVPIFYKIAQGVERNGSPVFGIDNATGELFTSQTLDREADESFFLLVQAYQSDKPDTRVASTFVEVTVDDVNDNRPVMGVARYIFSIPENTPTDLEVGQVAASDMDKGDNAVFRFYLEDQRENAFSIDPASGILTVKNSEFLDREARESFSFKVYAEDVLTNPRLRSEPPSNITIMLADVNDNSPTFLNNSYLFLLNETVAANTPIGMVSATDIDTGENGVVRYGLERPSSQFSVDNITGEITVTSRLSPKTYKFFVRAGDQANNTALRRFSSVPVNIFVSDVNNNNPEFIPPVQQTADVREGARNYSLAYLLVADRDQNDILTCTKDGGDTLGSFTVSYKSEITSCQVWVNGGLDRERESHYNLTLHLSDGPHDVTTVLAVNVLDENDNSPSFVNVPYIFNITEGIYTGNQAIGKVQALDNDMGLNAKITYSASHGNFSVDCTSGEIYVLGDVDCESTQIVRLEVVASDGGEPTLIGSTVVQIHVTDLNDNAPYFTQESVNISLRENSPPGEFFIVQAKDNDVTEVNSRILYRLVSGNGTVFKVSPNGSVSTLRSLDSEGQDEYIISIEAYNEQPYSNNQLRNGSITIYLTITDANDKSPQFTNTRYSFNAKEDWPEGMVVGRVHATDGDTNPEFRKILYSIRSGNEAGYFQIESLSGTITINKSLDYELLTNETLRLQILAQNTGRPSNLNATAQVEIQVENVNDEPPKFQLDQYNWTIQEKQAEANFTLTSATDEDSPSLTYKIANTDGSLPFTINIDTINGDPVLTLQHSLNYETRQSYDIQILVNDNGTPDLTGSTVVLVFVENIQDPPEFLSSTYNFTVAENDPPGTPICWFTVTDGDGDNLSVSLNDTAFRPLDLEGVNATTSQFCLATNSELDYETGENVRIIQVQASDGVFNRTTIAVIEVTDRNDNSPNFTQTVYKYSIAENIVTTELCLVEVLARDRDSGDNGNITLSDYEIVTGAESGLFHICANGSAPCVCVTRTLDYETRTQHHMLLQATDNGSPPRRGYAEVEITVEDDNDQAPSFSQDTYTAVIPEGTRALITRVSSNDNDTVTTPGFPVYKVDSTSYQDGLALEFVGKELWVNSSGVDRENQSLFPDGSFNINITVNDSRHIGRAQVHVSVTDVNEYMPRIDGQQNSTVPRNIHVGTPVLQIEANDLDATNLGFTFWLTRGGGLFTINSTTGMISVANSLSQSSESEYDLTVFVIDHGMPPKMTQGYVVVRVNESNRFPPVFAQTAYTFEVTENQSNWTLVGVVNATDRDGSDKEEGTVTYALSTPIIEVPFDVDAHSGEVRTTSSLDRERRCVYNLSVMAVDGGVNPHTAYTQITVNIADENDNVPEFGNVTRGHTVASSAQEGALFTVAASDADCQPDCHITNCSLLYDLRVVNLTSDKGAFTIDGKGIVTVHNLVNSTIGKSVILNISVSDGENNVSREFAVFVYAPSELPRAAQQDPVFLSENLSGMSFIADINATIGSKSADECLEYSLSPLSDEIDRFTVNKSTGVLMADSLDYETQHNLTVTVVATAMVDCEAKPQRPNPQNKTSIQINVYLKDEDDCAPEFEKSSYRQDLSEGSPVDSTVTTVTASDCDSIPAYTAFTYSIDPETNNNYTFSINKSTGSITVARALSILDQPEYNLTLLVTGTNNASLFGKSYLFIRLLDVNDHNPKFNQSIYRFSVREDAGNDTRKGRFVGQVIATDPDSGPDGELSYSITSFSSFGLFDVLQNGSIVTDGLIDRETQEKHIIIVTAEDKGSPSRKGTCEVEISVLDVNDHKPQLDSAVYIGTARDGASFAFHIPVEPSILARDEDGNDNGISYYAIYGEGSENFGVDNRDIYVNVSEDHPLDREKTPVYYLSLVAVDKHGLNSTAANLTIIVEDVNDNPPVFNQSQYQFQVGENQGGAVVGWVYATDVDIKGHIRYTISTGDDGRFFIGPSSGEIRVTDGIDREYKPGYLLTVHVWDGVHNDSALVNITVLDENDNSPKFEEAIYRLQVVEESANAVIGQVSARDIDEGVNGHVLYKLNSSSLAINSSSGEIRTLVALDREAETEVRATVFAFDGGSPPRNSSVEVIVTLEDINDNTPQFLPIGVVQLNASILEKSPVNSVIAWPQAQDPDAGANGSLSFTLSGPGDEYFNVNPKTGLMTLRDRIDLNTLHSKGYVSENSTESFVSLLLTVTVSDGGLPPRNESIPLTVNVEGISDLAPQFLSTSYNFTVKEGQVQDYEIGRLRLLISGLNSTAVPPQPHYKIVDSHSVDNYFTITPGGRPSVETESDWVYESILKTAAVQLDFERETEVILIIRAGDGKVPERSAYALVSVSVEDVNDNSPQCQAPSLTLTVPENRNVSGLAQVTASDSDSGDNAKLVYTLLSDNTNGSIDIERDNGRLSVVKPLDRELQDVYGFDILVHDSGSPVLNCTVSGELTVTDENDNIPVFYGDGLEVDILHVSVPEDAAPGKLVLNVYANDTDEGINGEVFYRLDPQDNQNFFIHPRDGELYTLGNLDYETVTSYILTVVAYDLGTPPQSGTVTVSVEVIDVDDTVRLQPLYEFYISGSTPLHSVVGTIRSPELLFFNITGGNEDLTFDISSSSGEIHLLKPPTLRSTPFNLTVMTTDYKTPPVARYTNVLIHTQDTVLKVEYPENQEPFQLIVDINTTEEVSGQSVTYSFLNLSYPELFNLSSETGEIFSLKSLDREAVEKYTLFVRGEIKHTGARRRRAFGDGAGDIMVEIEVGDENDNMPSFGTDKMTFGLPRSDSFNYLVATLKATDADTGNNSAILYTIISGDTDSLGVDPFSGELRCTRDLAKTFLTQLNIRVNATDNLGQGHSTEVDITVLVISDSDRAILVARQPTSVVNKYIPAIQGNLSAILSYNISVETVKPHTDHTDGGSRLNPEMSDIYIHALDPVTGGVVLHDDLLRRLAEKDAEIKDFFRRFNIKELTPLTVIHEPYDMSISEIALICMAAVIFVGSILSMGVVVYSSKRYDMERLRSQQAESARAKASETVPNPVYSSSLHGNNLDSDSAEPLEFDNSVFGVFEDSHRPTDFHVTNISFMPNHNLKSHELSSEMKNIPVFESQELTMDMFTETTSDYEEVDVAESSVSSEGQTVQNHDAAVLRESLPDFFDRGQPVGDSGNVTEAEIHSDKDSDTSQTDAVASTSTGYRNPAFTPDSTGPVSANALSDPVYAQPDKRHRHIHVYVNDDQANVPVAQSEEDPLYSSVGKTGGLALKPVANGRASRPGSRAELVTRF